MELEKKSTSSAIAMLFGLLALATATALVVDSPKAVQHVLALFWGVTGLLAFYLAASAASRRGQG